MTEVKFYEAVDDGLLDFAVILAKHQGKWVFCKHRERSTFEIPGGHREPGEQIGETAKRELYEETGALDFDIAPVCVYSVISAETHKESFGMLFYADIRTFEQELHYEIEKIIITNTLPDRWTYAEIQPKLLEEAKRRGIQ